MPQHITLVAGPAFKASAADASVNVGGESKWTRFQWLGIDLRAAAAQVAALCHELGIDPVIRVGANASGYPSLKTSSGITDSPTAIPNFPWDVFGAYLAKAYSSYEVPQAPVDLVAEVEEAAIKGDDKALTEVIAIAASDDEEAAEEAKAVLAKVPVDELEAWNSAHEKVADGSAA